MNYFVSFLLIKNNFKNPFFIQNKNSIFKNIRYSYSIFPFLLGYKNFFFLNSIFLNLKSTSLIFKNNFNKNINFISSNSLIKNSNFINLTSTFRRYN